jgi:aryl-alcohol dehydrogenase-like predicted oxidoreductase
MVKTLPFADLQVPIPGFGAMGLNSSMGTDFNFEQSEPVLLKALKLGCTFWDTAVSRPMCCSVHAGSAFDYVFEPGCL